MCRSCGCDRLFSSGLFTAYCLLLSLLFTVMACLLFRFVDNLFTAYGLLHRIVDNLLTDCSVSALNPKRMGALGSCSGRRGRWW